jgi:predicted acylesterase/phospholipase RssA
MAAGEFWILALSGGGARGLFTAKVLAEMEARLGHPLADHFDLIAGTSVGGILALGIANEIRASKMLALFDQSPAIFSPRTGTCLLGLPWFKAKFSNAYLRSLLEETFGTTTIGDLKHRIMIPSVNYTKGTPSFFKTPHHPRLYRDAQYSLVDVALATSAAPTYFPVHRFADQHFVDGGLVANAPGLTAVHEAMQFIGHDDIKTIHVVAVGTAGRGTSMDPGLDPDMGIVTSSKRRWYWPWALGWGARIFDLTINAQEAMSNDILRHWIKEHFHLIDRTPDSEQTKYLGLDDVSDAARTALLGQAAVAIQNDLSHDLTEQIRQHQPLAPKFFHGPNKNASQ